MLGDAVIHLSYPLAFAAGVVSFLSPCVLPLLPAYLAYLGGRVGGAEPARAVAGTVSVSGGASAAALGGPGAMAVAPPRSRQAPLLANGVAFVLGFTVVFVVIFYVFE